MANTFYAIDATKIPRMLFVATQSGAIVRGDNGAYIVNGTVLLNSPNTALAMTAGVPVAGPPELGGDDGAELVIAVAQNSPLTAGISHTVTFPANAIEGAFQTLTFLGETNNYMTLVALGGVWYRKGGTAPVS